MNRYKCKNYKSAVQFWNSTDQPIVATDLSTDPVVFALGAVVTDTGVALDANANGISIEAGGLYRIAASFDVLGVTPGDVTFALMLDGQVMPETVATITAVAGISELISIETIREINVCCGASEHNVTLIAYSDGTGAATVERLAGNAFKIA